MELTDRGSQEVLGSVLNCLHDIRCYVKVY